VAYSRRPFFRACPGAADLSGVLADAPEARMHLADRTVEVVVYGRVKAAEQNTFVKGLGQVANRPVAERLSAAMLFGKGRYEYERHATSPVSQKNLQLDPVHRRHADVSDHAPGIVELRRCQEILGGGKGPGDIAKGSDEIIQPGADRRIVVND